MEGKAVASVCRVKTSASSMKRRSATPTKVLTYHIIDMGAKKLTIHYRLSDVKSGTVDASYTLHVSHPQQAGDVSLSSRHPSQRA